MKLPFPPAILKTSSVSTRGRTVAWLTAALALALAGAGTGCGQGAGQTAPSNPTASAPSDPREGMKPVPAGQFLYGASEAQIEFYLAQSMVNFPGMAEAIRESFVTPQQTPQLPAFHIQEFEVTNQEFKAFLDATGYRPQNPANYLKIWQGATYPDWAETFPVVWVSQKDASAFCSWRGGYLPTEQEWEKAARGADGRFFPWGNVFPGEDVANYSTQQAEPVGNRPGDESPYGIYDMGGNVAELTQSVVEIAGQPHAVVRGGSFAAAGREMLTMHRDLGATPEDRRADLGFRCAAK